MFEYDYVPLPKRGKLAWPGGKRVALIFTFNLETWDLVKDTDEPYYAGGPALLPNALAGRIPDYPNYSWREYGQRVESGAFLICLTSGAPRRAALPTLSRSNGGAQ